MNQSKKNVVSGIFSVLYFMFCISLQAIDTIAIIAPADNATVSGSPFTMSGTSSRANFRIKITINSTDIGSAITNGSGNWNFTLQNLANGDYTITAELISSTFEILASDTHTFTIRNPETISIASPLHNEIIFSSRALAEGQASLSSTTVRLSVDGVLMTTTATDGLGNWQAEYTLTTNDVHTLLAELIVSGSTVASSSVAIISSNSIALPSGSSQLRLVAGSIIMSGSGSGQGYNYSATATTATLNFDPIFTATPILVLTGENSGGSSTTTITSLSTGTAQMSCTTGTEKLYFAALTLL